MPKGSPEIMRVMLTCGHICRYFKKTKNDMYYCFTCEEHKPVKEKLKQDRRN